MNKSTTIKLLLTMGYKKNYKVNVTVSLALLLEGFCNSSNPGKKVYKGGDGTFSDKIVLLRDTLCSMSRA